VTTTVTKSKVAACRVCCREVQASVSLAMLNALFGQMEGAAILGGNAAKANGDGFSYWAAEPREVFEFRSGRVNPLGKLQAALDKYKPAREGWGDLPKGIFAGGWIGYFGYELGRYIEKLPETTVDDLQMPLIRLCFYDRLVAYRHASREFWLIALELSDDAESAEEKIEQLDRLLKQAADITAAKPPTGEIENIDLTNVRCNMSRQYYLDAFEKIRRYIYDGEVYQINFSQRFEADCSAQPMELFSWQSNYNPSPYAAYIDAGDFQIVSASPEMFITIRDGQISTKPIKGTRRRYGNGVQAAEKLNRRNFAQLLSSEKEKAELNMIIDLERNDVARICRPGTRRVSQPRTIEPYPTVFHAVATVTGELRKDVRFCDVLRAMFPGGSITGAPKIRAMEIIDETEPTARGVYTGGIGYVGLDGSVCLNIAIRTIIVKNQTAYVQTGGGIVADSDPQAEWDETITKARALLAGIATVQNSRTIP